MVNVLLSQCVCVCVCVCVTGPLVLTLSRVWSVVYVCCWVGLECGVSCMCVAGWIRQRVANSPGLHRMTSVARET